MFRKIRSNRAPEKTVWADLKDELAPYLQRVYHSSSTLIKKFPKAIFTLMVISLIYSVLWSFSSDKKPTRSKADQMVAKKDSSQNVTAIDAGLNSISKTADHLRRTMAIRQKVDSVLHKEKLSRADSIFLENALLELKKIQIP